MTTESPDLAIRQLLFDDGDVNKELAGRVYMLAAPQSAKMPYAVVTPVSIEPQHHLNGAGTLFRADIQVDFYDRSIEMVRRLARAGRLALHGRPNPTYVTIPDPTGHNPDEEFTLHLCQLVTDDSDLFQPTDGSDVPTYRASHTYRVAYSVGSPKH